MRAFSVRMSRGVILAVAPGFLAAPASAQYLAEQMSGHVAEQISGRAFSLERLEELAVANNPTLVQAQAGIAAAVGHRDQAGRHPNPTISYAGGEISFKRPGDGSQHMLVLEQPILLGGKRRYRTELAVRSEDQARIEAEAQLQRVLTDVRLFFYRVLAADELLRLRGRLADLASEAVEVTGQLVNVGAAARPDLLESSVEARRAAVALSRARSQAAAARRQLAAVVGHQEVEIARLQGDLEGKVPDLTYETVLADLYGRSPELAFARMEILRAEALVRSVQAEGTPDLSLMAGVGWNTDRFEAGLESRGWQGQIGVSLELPVFDHNQGEVASALAFKHFATSAIRRIELSIRSRVAGVFADYDSARSVVEVYQAEIIPAAEEAQALYSDSYERMAASYPQVLIAQRSLLEVRAEHVEGLDALWHAAVTMQGLLLTDGLSEPGTISAPAMSTPAGVGHEQ